MPRAVRLLAAPLITLLLMLAAGQLVAETEDGWVVAAKAREPQDISLWTRVVPGAELKAFRGATHTDVPLANAVALLYDVATMPEWIFRCREARILGVADNGDTFVYLKIHGIWPVGDRDAIIRVHPVYNAKTGELVVTGTAAPGYAPEVPGYVRIPAIESSWRMTPVAGNLLRIEWSGHVDPAGNIPRWLSNSVATLVPRYTMREVRNLLQAPAWRTAATRDRGNALLAQVRSQAH